MSHFSIAGWCDFVRGLADERTAREMESHLAAGCARCAATVSRFREIAAAAESERRHAPGAGLLRSVKAAFALRKPADERLLPTRGLELAFDSCRQPAVGLRGEPDGDRKLVFASQELTLSLDLVRGPDRLATRIGGEIVDSVPAPIADVPVLLMVGASLESQALSDGEGRFRLDFRARGDERVRLCLPVRDDLCYELPIPRGTAAES